jgi:glycerol-3-phosphate dehydrogenase
MNAIDYRSMAEEWLDHVVQQYGRTQVRRKDIPLIEYLLRAGFTLIAVRDKSRMLKIDFLGRRSAM